MTYPAQLPDSVETCMVGQKKPCGQQATQVIAVAAVVSSVFDLTRKDGGVIFLCAEHASTPAADWGPL
jgi:hypothetical protein